MVWGLLAHILLPDIVRAQLVLEGLRIDALLGEDGGKLGRAAAGAFSHAGEQLVHFLIVQRDTHARGGAHLQMLVDQLFQRLFARGASRR